MTEQSDQQTTSPTSDVRQDADLASGRAVEGYDDLPSDVVEHVVDYAPEQLHADQDQLDKEGPEETTVLGKPMNSYSEYLATLPKTADLMVEVTVELPDGRRFRYEEAQTFELDEDGGVPNFDYQEDATAVLDRVYEVMDQRLRR